MARIEAWNFLKKLPDGTVNIVIRQKLQEGHVINGNAVVSSVSVVTVEAKSTPASPDSNSKEEDDSSSIDGVASVNTTVDNSDFVSAVVVSETMKKDHDISN